MSDHSLLSASSAERWVQCPISVTATGDNTSNRNAAEGTFLHHVSEGVLTGGSYPTIGSNHRVDGYDFVFTEDMQRDCQTYVSFVQQLPWMGTYTVEGKVFYSRHLAVPRNFAFGTSDCRGFTESAEGRILEIIDLKMGRKPVNPAENPQAILYAAGVLEELGDMVVLSPNHLVRVSIMQPRLSSKPFQWLTTVGHIQQRCREMRPAAQAAVAFHNGNPTDEMRQQFPELPGSHCGYCLRKAECGAFQANLKRAASATTVQWDAQLFAMRSAIKTHLEDLEQLALDSAMSGNQLPGTKLVQGRKGNPQLRVDENTIKSKASELGVLTAIVQVKEVFATPAKVRDAFKAAGMQPADLALYIEQSEGKPVIADADDPRKPYETGIGKGFTGVAQPQPFTL